jgi:SAM-dependent methyltransferase
MYGKKASLYCDYFAGREDIPFFRRLVLSTGGPVLNMGCGTGALALDLAGAGLEVVGVDSSPYMLDIARDKADKLPPSSRERLHFVEGDIQDFPWESQFTTALLARGSFARLLSSEEQLRCLANLRKLLVLGGKIVLDLYPPRLELLQGGTSVGRSVNLDGDVKLLRTVHSRCDLINQRCYLTTIYQQYKGGVLLEQVLEESAVSLLFPREIMLLLRHSRFSVEEVYGDTGGGSFTASSRRMIIVASKA